MKTKGKRFRFYLFSKTLKPRSEKFINMLPWLPRPPQEASFTCVILTKSSTGRAQGRSGSRRLFRPGLSSSRSQGCEWQRGSWGGRLRRREEGVLQAEDGEAGTAPPGGAVAAAPPPGGGADAWLGNGGGGRNVEEAESLMSTGEREKRRWGGGGGCNGEGEDEQEEGEGKKQQQAPPPAAASLGSQGKLQGRGESGDSARLKKVGLDDECRDEFREELGARRGQAPPPATPTAIPPPASATPAPEAPPTAPPWHC